jgi:hypothetical protein
VAVEAPEPERGRRGEERDDESHARPPPLAPSPLDGLEYPQLHRL